MKNVIDLIVFNKHLKKSDENSKICFVGDNGNYKIHFELDEPRIAMFAVFKKGMKQQEILLDESSSVKVPLWCLKDGWFDIGLISDGYATTSLSIPVRSSIIDESGQPTEDPPPGLFEQLTGLVNELKEKEIPDSDILRLINEYLKTHTVTASNGVQNASIDSNGTLVVTLESGETINCGSIKQPVGNGLKYEDGKLAVNTASDISKDNTLPVSSALMHTEIGNINILLSTI